MSTPESTRTPFWDDDEDTEGISIGLLDGYDRLLAEATKLFGVNVGRPGHSRWYPILVNYVIPPLGFMYSRLWPVTIIGRENFPTSGPVLVLSNHAYFVDPFLTVYKLRDRQFSAINKLENFHGIFACVIRGMGQIPFARHSKPDQLAMTVDISEAILRGGGVIAVYPEGSRMPAKITKWHTLIPSKILARFSEVAIVPMSVTYKWTGRKRGTIIKIGEPEYITGAVSDPRAKEITKRHRERVVEMSGLADLPKLDAVKEKKKARAAKLAAKSEKPLARIRRRFKR